eukprot:GILK01007443.1.p1 GENE.GILK01007443.1~~GILK01007443.1.p1  ORF type:complete len:342 (-),score=11.95 GILK01007443.1:410-1435(-)
MGLPEDLVVGDSEQWLCPICHDVVEDAVETPCEHLFCRSCIVSLPRSDCPVCRQSFHLAHIKAPHRIIREHLSRLRMRCALHAMGCETLLPLSQMAIDQHAAECPFVEVKCEQATPWGEQCPARMKRSDAPNHLSTECLYYNVGCSNIGCEDFVARKYQQEHTLTCLCAVIVCVCGGQYVRKEKDAHNTICPEILVTCVQQGCTITTKRKHMYTHLDECGFVNEQCHRCGSHFIRNSSGSHDCITSLRHEKDELRTIVDVLRQQVESLQSTVNILNQHVTQQSGRGTNITEDDPTIDREEEKRHIEEEPMEPVRYWEHSMLRRGRVPLLRGRGRGRGRGAR